MVRYHLSVALPKPSIESLAMVARLVVTDGSRLVYLASCARPKVFPTSDTDLGIKCDERRPLCSNCETRGIPCGFSADHQNDSSGNDALPGHSEDVDVKGSNRKSKPLHNEPGQASFSIAFENLNNTDGVPDIPESKLRRMLELRLLVHYTEHIMQPFPDLANAHLVTAWGAEVPRMALEYDNVMYMLFALSACHLVRREPTDTQLAMTADLYLGLALREQHKAVAKLNIENSDAVMYSAMMLLITSIARLWNRSLEPYKPPMEWLRLGSGAGTVMRTAKEFLQHNPASKILLFLRAPPVFDVKVIFDKENLKPFSRVLESEMGRVDAATMETYEKTLCYIGYLYRSVDDDEPIYVVGRKIVSFTMFMPIAFLELVEQQRPCALVILAHFFALMARYPSIWWIGKSPKREIQAIHDMLSQEYQDFMHWPMMRAGLIMS